MLILFAFIYNSKVTEVFPPMLRVQLLFITSHIVSAFSYCQNTLVRCKRVELDITIQNGLIDWVIGCLPHNNKMIK